MKRVPYAELEAALVGALHTLGFKDERASRCGRLFAETTQDGVYTHGLARFPRFAQMVKSGVILPDAVPTLTAVFGCMERWNGNRGPGNLNAWVSMQRAVDLARVHGIGAVFLAETNHWMRGGTYAWQAADAGCFSMCWTNTMPNLPAWGATEALVGNNPLVLGVPRANGEHVVLDMAMSQYSYGTLAAYAKRGEALPFAGGFDTDGKLTTDAAAIEKSGRALPIGLWKGAGLAVMLDLFASMLSGGNATCQIEPNALQETGMSQVFVAIDGAKLGVDEGTAEAVIASLHGADGVRYPGEQTLSVRQENLAQGVPVDEDLWEQLLRRQF